jgi:hypothetical protein
LLAEVTMEPSNQAETTTTVPQATGSDRGSPARRATGAIESFAERGADLLWARLRQRPYLGVAVAGGVGLALASAVGVGELAIAALCAYAAYGMLARHEPPSKAFRDAAQVEKDLDL